MGFASFEKCNHIKNNKLTTLIDDAWLIKLKRFFDLLSLIKFQVIIERGVT